MAEYGFKPDLLPDEPPGRPQYCSCSQKGYTGGHPCSNPSNSNFKPPVSQVLPSGHHPHVQRPNFRPIHPVQQTNVQAYYWVNANAWGGVPSAALRGGTDVDGHQIYVGRAYHAGDWIPAKVIPGKNIAYVAYNGGEHPKDSFQVLCEEHPEQRFDWVCNHGGFIPSGAVEGGRTLDGEILYIGRVYHRGSQTVGKVHPSHGSCYIPFAGKEHAFRDYEILILRR